MTRRKPKDKRDVQTTAKEMFACYGASGAKRRARSHEERATTEESASFWQSVDLALDQLQADQAITNAVAKEINKR